MVWQQAYDPFGNMFISTLLGAFNGYVLTKWRFPGHRLIFGLMLFGCFIPFQVVLVACSD